MKLVAESLTDVLKPKPQEEIADITSQVLTRATNEFDSIEQHIADLKKLKRSMPKDVWFGDHAQTHDRLLAAFYDLPDYFQTKFADRFEELHQKIDRIL